jgi:hypothetical protein
MLHLRFPSTSGYKVWCHVIAGLHTHRREKTASPPHHECQAVHHHLHRHRSQLLRRARRMRRRRSLPTSQMMARPSKGHCSCRPRRNDMTRLLGSSCLPRGGRWRTGWRRHTQPPAMLLTITTWRQAWRQWRWLNNASTTRTRGGR